MSQTCTSEPVSWLTLERRALGELDAAALARVEAHLADCGVCAACARRIEEDRVVLRALPPLPVAPRAPVVPLMVRARSWSRWGLPLATAAALVLWMSGRERGDPDDLGGVKGDGVAVVVVGPDGRARTEARAGEPLRVQVTCTPRARARTWEVVVYDGDGASFPLDPAEVLSCGNGVTLPGALALDGRAGPATICVVLGSPEVPARDALADRAALPKMHACTEVRVR